MKIQIADIAFASKMDIHKWLLRFSWPVAGENQTSTFEFSETQTAEYRHCKLVLANSNIPYRVIP